MTYSLHLEGAMLVRRNLGEIWLEELTSPRAIVLQVITLGFFAGLMLIDWAPIVRRFTSTDDDRTDTHDIEL